MAKLGGVEGPTTGMSVGATPSAAADPELALISSVDDPEAHEAALDQLLELTASAVELGPPVDEATAARLRERRTVALLCEAARNGDRATLTT